MVWPQGLLPREQARFAAAMARVVSERLLHPDAIANGLDDERLRARVGEALREELVRADPEWRDSPPVLRLSRLTAELRFRAGSGAEWEEIVPDFAGFQRELERIDAELEERYFGAPAPAAAI